MLSASPAQHNPFCCHCFESRSPGKERDAESGLDDFEARFYSSSLGRFMQPDEFTGGPVDASSGATDPPGPLPYADITNPQSLNKYSYTYNNPLNMTDPDGHCPTCPAAAAGAAIGFFLGMAAEVVADVATGREIDGRKVFASGVNGAVVGGVAGLTGGASLLVSAAAVGEASVIGGMTERAINGESASAVVDPKAMAWDGAIGAGGQVLSRGVGKAVDKLAGKELQQTEQKLGYSKLGDSRRARLEGQKAQQQAALGGKKKAAEVIRDVGFNATARGAHKVRTKKKEQPQQ